jgi:cytochrome P450
VLTRTAGWGACVGRGVALRAMRAVIAALVRRFDIELAPGFDRLAWEEEASVFVERQLWVVLHDRARDP